MAVLQMNNLNIPYGWKILKISELFDFLPTGSHSREDMTFSTNQDSIYNIHYGDLHTKYNGYVDFDHDKVPALKKNDYRNEMLLQNGDLVVVDASEDYEGVGTAVELKNLRAKKCIAGLHTFAFRDKVKYTVDGYRSLLFQNPSTRRKMMQVSTYSKVFGVTKSSISDIKVILPTTTEQERIVSVLETWDEYLELLDKKIALKEQLKKGLMQQFFACGMRIPGYSDNREYIKLGKISKMSSGGTPKSTDSSFYGGDIPWVSISDMTGGGKYLYRTLRNLTQDGLNNSAARIYPKDTILYAMYASIGECSIAGVPMSSSQAILGIIPDEKCLDSVFLYYYLSFIKERVKMQGQQGTQSNLNAGIVRDFNISLPSLSEQKEIVSMLVSSDEELTSFGKLKTIVLSQKKFLLNNLITGKILTPENLSTKGVN